MKVDRIIDEYLKGNNFSLFAKRIKRILKNELKKRSLTEQLTLENFEKIFDEEKENAFGSHLRDKTLISFELINKATFELKQQLWIKLTDGKQI